MARHTEEPEVPGSIPDPAHTFVEIDQEIFLWPSPPPFPPSTGSRGTGVSY